MPDTKADDWAKDVRKYAKDADEAVIAGIVRYCGIALRKPDSAMVSFSDPKELARVKANYLRKKLALTQPDAALDAAIAAVGERMKKDRTKNRVTVYYLLAENLGALAQFRGKAKAEAPAKAAVKTPAKKAPAKAAAAAADPAPTPIAKAKSAARPKPATKPKAAPAAKPAAAPKASAKTTPKAAAKPKAAAAKTKAATPAAAPQSAIDASAATSTPAKPAPAPAPVPTSTAAAKPVAAAATTAPTDDDSGLGWLVYVLLGLLVLFALWWVFVR